MENQDIISNLIEQNQILLKRIDLLEFRLELLAEGSNISSLLFEYKIPHDQYSKIMDLMDEMRKGIDTKNTENVNNVYFEMCIEKITGINDYHFAEYVAKAFWEDGRWEEVFPALYGDFLKYKNILENENG